MHFEKPDKCAFDAEIEPGGHVPSRGTTPMRTEQPRRVKGSVAFLELENDPEEGQIHAKLKEVADPLFPNVARCENEGRCYLVLWAINSAVKEEVVFKALCDAAQAFSEASPSTRRFYSAKEFWDMDKEAFERFMECAFRPDLGSAKPFAR